MEFVLNRNKTHSSRLGHTIQFIKGVKTHVPPELWPEVRAFGAVPAEDIPEEALEDQAEPRDPQARKALIFATMEKMVVDGKRADFTGTGAPHAGSMKDRMGFAIDAKERDTLWSEFQARGTEE
jgi:hypothetical protein